MGQESSSPIGDDVPPRTLGARTVNAVGKLIRDGKIKKVVVMTGAGISTSAGIPDFRSPETGLYANLARLKLPYAEAVFDISYFRGNPLPFYTLAHELYPGNYRPTITHSFISLLQDKGLLLKLFTQNIDCLEREAGVKDENIVEAHGSFATQRCIECKTAFPDDKMLAAVKEKEVPRCMEDSCNGLVKPDIVFFGEQLPEAFFANHRLPAEADLAIILGTSLTVHPFAALPDLVPEGVPRLLINLDRVGSLGSRPDDVLLLMDCDSGIRKLADYCNWLDELEKKWAETEVLYPSARSDPAPQTTSKTGDQAVGDEVDKLTREIDEALRISRTHATEEMDRLLAEKQAVRADLMSQEERKPTISPSNVTEKVSGGLMHVFPHMRRKSTL